MMGSGAFPQFSGEKFTGSVPSAANDADLRQLPSSDPRVPLFNLSLLGRKMGSLRQFLSDSVDRHADIGADQIHMVSTEIAAAVQQIILNGAALLASSQGDSTVVISPAQIAGSLSNPVLPTSRTNGSESAMDLIAPMCRAGPAKPSDQVPAEVRMNGPDLTKASKSVDPIGDVRDGSDPTAEDESDCEIVEIDAVELLAEHIHFCEVCGKGFKRDANLRMHMRAHGNRFKTLEALSKPDHTDAPLSTGRKTRFSCPFVGCNRNRSHKRFRPLKSAICVKNHFKRSHCPKMFSCTRCNKKSFSVLADLKSHLKHCGECRWQCSCGTSFSRKDKLFGHMALFEGHMPAVKVEDEVEKGKETVMEENEDEEGEKGVVEAIGGGGLDPEFFDGLMDGFKTVDGWCWDSIL